MAKTKNFKVQMFRVEGDVAPFVKVDYMDQDANGHAGLMLLDSCSMHNVLFKGRVDKFGMVLQKEEGSMLLHGSGDQSVKASIAKFNFALGGKQFHEPFCVHENDIQIPSLVGDLPIIGILGIVFLERYGLAIDYSNFTLHTSNVSPKNLKISDCDFFFPMTVGMKYYGLPILSSKHNGKEIIVLADTGATNNMMASQTISEKGLDCRYLENTDVITGIAGNTEVKEAILKFSLLTFKDGDTEELQHEDIFSVLPHYMLTPKEGECDEDGEQLPPVDGIIGSPFMARENWVLDFGQELIYKRKTPKVVDMDPRVKCCVSNNNEQNEPEMCGEMKSRSISFYANAIEKGMPFIRVSEGDLEGIIMLIDTGSNDNIICGHAYHQLEEYFKPVEGQCNLYGMEGNPVVVNFASSVLSFCGKEYEMEFLIREDSKAMVKLSEEMGFPISGIIGTKFMAEHGWQIDFGKQEIVIPASDISAREFRTISKKLKEKK